jgi:hypothetical protein
VLFFLFLVNTSFLAAQTTLFTMSTTTTVTETGPITAQSILRLFPEIDTTSGALEGHDEEQIRLMDEVCIVLDENDKPIGTASKKLCMSGLAHVRPRIEGHVLIRRRRPLDDQHR